MTPFKTIPNSHNGFKVFESVARLLSFTDAAQELHVTQSAVSRQVKQLETELATKLILRKHRSIELTVKGQELFALLNKNYHSIELLLSSWKKPEKKKMVIKAALSYAIRTLIPKMQLLNAWLPDYEIVIIPTMEEEMAVNNDEYDLLIFNSRAGRKYKNSPDVFLLREEYMAPVYSESLAEGDLTIDQIITMPRLHPTLDHHDWKTWIAKMGCRDTSTTNDTTFYSLDMALSACTSGQGVTVTDMLLILRELQRGFLICPRAIPIHHSAWQYFCHQKTHSAEVDKIVAWLCQDSRQEIAQLLELAQQYGWTGVVDNHH